MVEVGLDVKDLGMGRGEYQDLQNLLQGGS